MTPPLALVVVPTFNERANLPTLIKGLMQHPNVKVMVVDDQSPDGTGEIADALAREHTGRIEVMHRTERRGLGRSYIDGIRKAIREPVDVICQMDADLSHDPATLPALVAAAGDLREGRPVGVGADLDHDEVRLGRGHAVAELDQRGGEPFPRPLDAGDARQCAGRGAGSSASRPRSVALAHRGRPRRLYGDRARVGPRHRGHRLAHER